MLIANHFLVIDTYSEGNGFFKNKEYDAAIKAYTEVGIPANSPKI